MSHPLLDLRAMSREELIENHDREAVNASAGVNYYLEELHRRDLEEQGLRMLALTEQMRDETKTMKTLTVVNVAVASGALLAAVISVIVTATAGCT
jgi:hypothetical protein